MRERTRLKLNKRREKQKEGRREIERKGENKCKIEMEDEHVKWRWGKMRKFKGRGMKTFGESEEEDIKAEIRRGYRRKRI